MSRVGRPGAHTVAWRDGNGPGLGTVCRACEPPAWRVLVNRLLRIIATAAVTALLVAGVAQAAKPVPGMPAGVGFADSTGNNFIIDLPLVGQGPAAVVNKLVLPNGNYLINGSLQVFNLSPDTETEVNCHLYGGGAAPGSTTSFLDISQVRLSVSTSLGSADKIPFTASLARVDGAAELSVRLECSSLYGARAQFGRLNAVSVSSLTETLTQ